MSKYGSWLGKLRQLSFQNEIVIFSSTKLSQVDSSINKLQNYACNHSQFPKSNSKPRSGVPKQTGKHDLIYHLSFITDSWVVAVIQTEQRSGGRGDDCPVAGTYPVYPKFHANLKKLLNRD